MRHLESCQELNQITKRSSKCRTPLSAGMMPRDARVKRPSKRWPESRRTFSKVRLILLVFLVCRLCETNGLSIDSTPSPSLRRATNATRAEVTKHSEAAPSSKPPNISSTTTTTTSNTTRPKLNGTEARPNEATRTTKKHSAATGEHNSALVFRTIEVNGTAAQEEPRPVFVLGNLESLDSSESKPSVVVSEITMAEDEPLPSSLFELMHDKQQPNRELQASVGKLIRAMHNSTSQWLPKAVEQSQSTSKRPEVSLRSRKFLQEIKSKRRLSSGSGVLPQASRAMQRQSATTKPPRPTGSSTSRIPKMLLAKQQYNNLSESASIKHENWANYSAQSDADDYKLLANGVFDYNEQEFPPKEPEQPGASSSNVKSSKANEDELDPVTTQRSISIQRQQHSRTTSEDHERPVTSESTTTTIDDGNGRRRVFSHAPGTQLDNDNKLPAKLRERIIEQFLKGGGDPQNIIVSDSTITTTSQSKKKTITTVYKIISAAPNSSLMKQHLSKGDSYAEKDDEDEEHDELYELPANKQLDLGLEHKHKRPMIRPENKRKQRRPDKSGRGLKKIMVTRIETPQRDSLSRGHEFQHVTDAEDVHLQHQKDRFGLGEFYSGPPDTIFGSAGLQSGDLDEPEKKRHGKTLQIDELHSHDADKQNKKQKTKRPNDDMVQLVLDELKNSQSPDYPMTVPSGEHEFKSNEVASDGANEWHKKFNLKSLKKSPSSSAVRQAVRDSDAPSGSYGRNREQERSGGQQLEQRNVIAADDDDETQKGITTEVQQQKPEEVVQTTTSTTRAPRARRLNGRRSGKTNNARQKQEMQKVEKGASEAQKSVEQAAGAQRQSKTRPSSSSARRQTAPSDQKSAIGTTGNETENKSLEEEIRRVVSERVAANRRMNSTTTTSTTTQRPRTSTTTARVATSKAKRPPTTSAPIEQMQRDDLRTKTTPEASSLQSVDLSGATAKPNLRAVNGWPASQAAPPQAQNATTTRDSFGSMDFEQQQEGPNSQVMGLQLQPPPPTSSRTHNIMMLIDFGDNQPPSSPQNGALRAPKMQETTGIEQQQEIILNAPQVAVSGRLKSESQHFSQNSAGATEPPQWGDSDGQWRPLSSPTGGASGQWLSQSRPQPASDANNQSRAQLPPTVNVQIYNNLAHGRQQRPDSAIAGRGDLSEPTSQFPQGGESQLASSLETQLGATGRLQPPLEFVLEPSLSASSHAGSAADDSETNQGLFEDFAPSTSQQQQLMVTNELVHEPAHHPDVYGAAAAAATLTGMNPFLAGVSRASAHKLHPAHSRAHPQPRQPPRANDGMALQPPSLVHHHSNHSRLSLIGTIQDRLRVGARPSLKTGSDFAVPFLYATSAAGTSGGEPAHLFDARRRQQQRRHQQLPLHQPRDATLEKLHLPDESASTNRMLQKVIDEISRSALASGYQVTGSTVASKSDMQTGPVENDIDGGDDDDDDGQGEQAGSTPLATIFQPAHFTAESPFVGLMRGRLEGLLL